MYDRLQHRRNHYGARDLSPRSGGGEGYDQTLHPKKPVPGNNRSSYSKKLGRSLEGDPGPRTESPHLRNQHQDGIGPIEDSDVAILETKFLYYEGITHMFCR